MWIPFQFNSVIADSRDHWRTHADRSSLVRIPFTTSDNCFVMAYEREEGSA